MPTAQLPPTLHCPAAAHPALLPAAEDGGESKMSKKQRKMLSRLKIAELKQVCQRPDVVEVWDVTAADPELLVFLKVGGRGPGWGSLHCAAAVLPCVQCGPAAVSRAALLAGSTRLQYGSVQGSAAGKSSAQVSKQRAATAATSCSAAAQRVPHCTHGMCRCGMACASGQLSASAYVHCTRLTRPASWPAVQGYRNSVSVPRHWSQKRKYLQGKRGIEKPPFELPDFIAATGISDLRQTYLDKENEKKLKAKQRDRMAPKMGKMNIDYAVRVAEWLSDA